MEANRKEKCDFWVNRLAETWHITEVWVKSQDNTAAWYEGETYRNGTTFKRIFTPKEITDLRTTSSQWQKNISDAKYIDGYKTDDIMDV